MYLNQELLYVFIGLSIGVGALQCFFGYRIFKIMLGLLGFLLGFALAATIGSNFIQEQLLVLLLGLVGGFIGAAVMVALYFVGVFLKGSLLGGILGVVLYAVTQSNPDPVTLYVEGVLLEVYLLQAFSLSFGMDCRLYLRRCRRLRCYKPSAFGYKIFEIGPEFLKTMDSYGI